MVPYDARKSNVLRTLKKEEPHRTTNIKRFMCRFMFLCAVGRPKYDFHRKRHFIVKFGTRPFVPEEWARQIVKNRNVTQGISTQYMLDKFFPAITSKFPVHRNSSLLVQQDNVILPAHLIKLEYKFIQLK